MLPRFPRLSVSERLGILAAIALYGIVVMAYWLANPEDPATPRFVAEIKTSLR